MIEGGLGGEVHQRMIVSYFGTLVSGVIGGYGAQWGFSSAGLVALGLASAILFFAVWHLPTAQTMAIQWREEQRRRRERDPGGE